MEMVAWALVSYGVLKFAPLASDIAGRVIDLVIK